MNSDFLEHIKIPESMDDTKMEFLRNALDGSKQLSQKDLIPYLGKLIKKAKEEHIVFNDEEIRFLIMSIKASSSNEESQAIDKLLHMSKAQEMKSKKQTSP